MELRMKNSPEPPTESCDFLPQVDSVAVGALQPKHITADLAACE